MYSQLIRLTVVLDEDVTPFKNLPLIGTWTTRAVDTIYYERNITPENRSEEENRKCLRKQNLKVSVPFTICFYSCSFVPHFEIYWFGCRGFVTYVFLHGWHTFLCPFCPTLDLMPLYPLLTLLRTCYLVKATWIE